MIELDPDNAQAHRNLGTLYLTQDRLEEAVTSYGRAIELDPGFGEAYGDLAGAYFNSGRFPEAIRINPGYADANQHLGNIYGDLGQFDDAIYYWNITLEIEPERAVTYKYLGMVYAGQNTGRRLDRRTRRSNGGRGKRLYQRRERLQSILSRRLVHC